MPSSGIATAILAALFMGTIGFFSRKTGLDPTVITFFRLFFGAAFLGLLLIATGRIRLLCQRPSWPVLLNGAMLAGFIVFYVQAMNLTTMANAIMVVYLAPLVSSIVAHFLLGEKLSLFSSLLIGLALFGFAMMMEFRLDISAEHLQGLAWAAAALLCYSSFILINRTGHSTAHVYTRTFHQLLAGAACMLPLIFTGLPEVAGYDWLWLLGAGLIPGFLGIFCAVAALEKLPAATYGTLAYFEPIFVVLIGWLAFAEALSPLQSAGCLLIIGCGVLKGLLSSTRNQSIRAGRHRLS
jgi:drug/metabolite transporter (DMT)-like permease